MSARRNSLSSNFSHWIHNTYLAGGSSLFSARGIWDWLRQVAESWRDQLRDVASVKRLANFVFVAAVCVLCAQQCWMQWSEYRKYSTRFQVFHTFPESVIKLLPGLTLCNNNRLRWDRLSELSAEFRQKSLELPPNMGTSNMNLALNQIGSDFSIALKQLLDDQLDVNELIENSTLPELVELSRTNMIKDVNCNNIIGPAFNCENIRIVESYQGRPCYTLFFIGSIREAQAQGRLYDFNSSLLSGGKKKVRSFGSHELAEVIVDLEPFQHLDFDRPIGGEIIVHSSSTIGSIRTLTHNMIPGKSYELIIHRESVRSLPFPYKSDCHDYLSLNLDTFKKKANTPASLELDRSTCYRNCFGEHIMKNCDCWPTETPYFPDDPSVNNSTNLRMCPWAHENERSSSSITMYIENFRKISQICRPKCKSNCQTDRYRAYVMSKEWPFDPASSSLHEDYSSEELERLRLCCARISIKYVDLMETENVMYPSMTEAQLMSNIGGIVSALVGVSLMTIYRYIAWEILQCKKVRDYTPDTQRKPRQVS